MYKKKDMLIGVFLIAFMILALGTIPLLAEGMHEHKDTMMESSINGGGDPGICPVTGEKANKDISYTYEGKAYYFCCPSCASSFKKDPEKYISKIKEVDLEAYQFGFSPEVISVKKGDIVKINATSRDVPHGVYIKEFGINATVKKGDTTKIEFLADKVGEFDILCSVYCGKGHRDMKAKLIVSE